MQLVKNYDVTEKVLSNPTINQKENILSSRYKVLTTFDILAEFLKTDWYISSYNGPKSDSKDQHGAHVVRLRNDAFKLGDGLFVEIVILNSYNGKIPFSIHLGIFRLVCENGMVAGENIFMEKIKHIGRDFYVQVYAALDRAKEKMAFLRENVEKMKNRELTSQCIEYFAEAVFKQRLESVKNLVGIDYNSSLTRERIEDHSNDLWTILNVIQEKILRGGIHYTIEKEIKDNDGKIVGTKFVNKVTKSVFQPKRTVELNKFAFDAATRLVA